jgi:hypothetical protein
MEAKRSSKTSRRHISEDGIVHSYRRENLKSYMNVLDLKVKGLLTGVPKQKGDILRNGSQPTNQRPVHSRRLNRMWPEDLIR